MLLPAFYKTDPHEDPVVVKDLCDRLLSQNINPIPTDKNWKDIIYDGPFLYFRNPHLRIDNEGEIAKLHKDSKFSKVYTADEEVVAVDHRGGYDFTLTANSKKYVPSQAPLPIMISTSYRAAYLQLTLNSLFYNLKSPGQKIYIIASNPSNEVMDVINSALKNTSVEVNAAIVKNSLIFSGTNFGSKFFDVEKFIIWDDDVILPPCYDYLVPFWTQQVNYRMSTADFVAFRVGGWNTRLSFLKCRVVSPLVLGEMPLPPPLEANWHYHNIDLNDRRLFSMGTLGMSGRHMLSGYTPPIYYKADMNYYTTSKTACLLNIPAYHMGFNQEMDYPDFNKHIPKNPMLARFQTGTDLRSGVKKTVDMAANWKEQN